MERETEVARPIEGVWDRGNGAGREGGVGLLRAARGKESRRWASPAARGSVGGDTGG